jgi:hypothetical protein
LIRSQDEFGKDFVRKRCEHLGEARPKAHERQKPALGTLVNQALGSKLYSRAAPIFVERHTRLDRDQ